MFMRLIPALAVLVLTTSVAVAEDKPADLKMGMVQGMFRDIPPAMVHAMSKPFRDLVQKQTGYSGEIDLCPDAAILCDKLRDKHLHIGIFHGFEFAWAQKRCADLLPLIVTVPHGNKVQAMIVVNAESKASTADQLKEIVIPKGAKAHSVAFMNKMQSTSKTKVITKSDLSSEDALFAVMSGEHEAILIDLAALEGFYVLRSSAKTRLKVLVESEEFPPAVVAYRKGMLNDQEADSIRKGLSTANQNATGKMLMTLWNLKGLEVPPNDYQNRLDVILKAYPSPLK